MFREGLCLVDTRTGAGLLQHGRGTPIHALAVVVLRLHRHDRLPSGQLRRAVTFCARRPG